MAIGQKLEEARNRKGISLREASESTKIRGDYLSAFESSNFDINLPEVYLRGFVRLYARFLDLDQDAVLADLDLELGNTNSKLSKKSLGSISSNESDSSEFSNTASTSNSVSRNNIPTLRKPLILVLSSLILVIIIICILIGIFSDEESTNQLTKTNGNSVSEIPSTPSLNQQNPENVNAPDSFVLKLSAIGPIKLLIIDDQGDGTPKDFKEISNGWESEMVISKSFRCHCSDIENLRFSIDGKVKKVDGVGPGNFSWQP